MILSNYFHRDNLHHCYLIAGEEQSIVPELLSFLDSKESISQSHYTFTIDDARNLKFLQSQKADQKFFIISTQFFTSEAQQALLKIFEDPTSNTHFFIITPQPDLLISTLRSRMAFIDLLGEEQGNSLNLSKAKIFLSANKSERLEIIKDLIKNNEDKDTAILKTEAVNLINNLEYLLKDKLKKDKETFIFKELNKCRNYLPDRGSSPKILLEHLALILPTII
ncbi:hypothetical protein A2995_02040 [Candidatus Nomurabacteria bacterium RIFCSPLOWO2_01_FULL_33_24]|uniref:DNA polymerase III subunit delta n=1 Tax=Candidatus Nomurabacteria bacterium RIFCSPLOWO2_01_FULL_33_24 TaxID=1801765 RepID=A0A1F6WZ81_9BACT|nr:MAG: hypothetical protein A2995_02040 [Candidatus Nomurabacteria bacterium RIFCSPLOWO2_01_FULL_33_24]